jgi:hypothetical protein
VLKVNLKHIKEVSCPICGDSVITKEEIEMDRFNKKLRQHCNGQMWEKRTFSCGQSIKWIPNFSCSELDEYSQCTNNVGYKIKMEKRENALNLVKAYIESRFVLEEAI